MSTLLPRTKTRLNTVGIDAHDGHPTVTPDGRYAALFDGDSNLYAHRANNRAAWIRATVVVICVARSRDGCRALVADVRDALCQWLPHPDAEPCTESSAGPILTDGPVGDRRHSITLTYTTTMPRSTT